MFFYCAIIGILQLTVLSDGMMADDKIRLIIVMMFPVGTNQYWFFSTYFILMLISPIINIVVQKLTKQSFQRFILLFSFLWLVLPMISFNKLNYQSSELLLFVLLYVIAAYIRNYVNLESQNKVKHLLLGCIVYVFNFLLIFVLTKLGQYKNIDELIECAPVFAQLGSILIIFSCLELFIGFLCLSPKYNGFVNYFAGSMFGVYLIHDNDIIRPFLWEQLRIKDLYNSENFLIYSIFLIFVVLVICTLIDLIRRITVEKLYFAFLNKYCGKIELIFDKAIDKIRKLVFCYKD